MVFTLYMFSDTSTARGEYFTFFFEGSKVPPNANPLMVQFGGLVRLKYSALQLGQQPRSRLLMLPRTDSDIYVDYIASFYIYTLSMRLTLYKRVGILYCWS